MKKLKNLLLILLIMMLVLPFSVRAHEGHDHETTKEPVNVYMFHSTSCTFCQAALVWFDSIEEEYGDYFNVVTYEVSTQENSNLWSEAATLMGDTPSGVPYIVVGKYSYPNGFAADSVVDSESEKTMGEEFIERIMETYESDNRYDVMVEINNKPDYSNIVAVVAVILVGGIIAMAIITRRQNR